MILRRWPDRILSTPAMTVTEFAGLDEVAAAMAVAMVQYEGVGLAANQVGRTESMFVARDITSGGVFVVVNPVVLDTHGVVTDEEGCLSLPGQVHSMRRPEQIVVEAYDVDGQPRRYELSGYQARIFCHEIDHLQGRLIGPGEARPTAPGRAAQ